MVVEVVNGQSEVGEAKAKTAALASATTSSRRHMSDTRPETVRRQSASPIEQPKIPTIAIMTENRAPAEPQPSATSAADQPGRPYYEQLRTTLRGTLDKKRKLDEQLAALEDQIFKLEGAYLEETSNSGNIVRGFDGWVKGVSVGGRAGDDRRRGRVRDEDRVFSHSSVGWMKAQEGPDSNTPSHAATPTGSVPASLSRAESTSGATGKTGNKKKRATDKDDDDEKAPKRGKITYSRE